METSYPVITKPVVPDLTESKKTNLPYTLPHTEVNANGMSNITLRFLVLCNTQNYFTNNQGLRGKQEKEEIIKFLNALKKKHSYTHVFLKMLDFCAGYSLGVPHPAITALRQKDILIEKRKRPESELKLLQECDPDIAQAISELYYLKLGNNLTANHNVSLEPTEILLQATEYIRAISFNHKDIKPTVVFDVMGFYTEYDVLFTTMKLSDFFPDAAVNVITDCCGNKFYAQQTMSYEIMAGLLNVYKATAQTRLDTLPPLES